ncbi:MAG: gamma-glutamylcyclotransferase [Chloracidobacterium sp.]|nr:gamma-glutamylcyclotransferase [Chloracidobacterium sp.]
MNTHLLFVYGTLRRGGENEIPRLHPTSRFAGSASVRGRLYDMGGYPAIVLDTDGVSVIGEAYEVDGETLAKLDAFELDAAYDRIAIDISIGGSPRSCWIYGPAAELCAGKPEIPSGDWIEYRRFGSG